MSGLSRGLYVFYQASDTSKLLYYSCFDGQGWSLNATVPQTMTESAIAPVVFEDRLYCFYQYGGELWYNTFDGNIWAGYRQVPGTLISCSPSAIVYNNQIYVFHQGTNNCGQLWYNIMSTGDVWTGDTLVPDTALRDSPSVVLFPDKSGTARLFCFHQGAAGAAGTLCYNVLSDSGAWQGDTQIPDTGIASSPSALVYDGRLVVMHAGGGDGEQLWCNTLGNDGNGWSGDVLIENQAMSHSPNACLFNNRIYCFFNVPGDAKNLSSAVRVGLDWTHPKPLTSTWLTGSPACIAV